MNLLIITPFIPHPKSGHGTGVFQYQMLRDLITRHRVTLLAFCTREEARFAGDLAALPLELIMVPRGRGAKKTLSWNLYLVAMRLFQILRGIVLWQPYGVSFYWHPRMARQVTRLTGRRAYDIVQCEMSEMGQYVRYVKKGKTVLHAHDVAFRPAYREFRAARSPLKRASLFMEWCRWFAYERKMTGEIDRILCVTEQDKTLVERLMPAHHASYLPRGIDVPETVPEYSRRESFSLLFIGTFSHRPNVDSALWLVREIFPLVLQRFPSSTLNVIGSHPPVELLSLAESSPRIKVLGFVDDVTGHLRRCSVFVAPLRYGGGIKLKILHAMAQGIPVVTTKIGMEGIGGPGPAAALVGRSAREIADHICSLLGNASLAQSLGGAGRSTIEQHFTREATGRRLDEIYGSLFVSSPSNM